MDEKPLGLLPAAGTFLGFSIKYTAYGALLFSVLITIGMLGFIDIAYFGGDVPFLKYFSFMLPADASGNADLDTGDVMRLYSFVTLLVLLASLAVRAVVWLGRRGLPRDGGTAPKAPAAANVESPILGRIKSIGRHLAVSLVVVTAIFAAAFIGIPRVKAAPGESDAGMYVIFAVFFVIACIAQVIYAVVDGLGEAVLGWSLPRLASQVAAFSKQADEVGSDRWYRE